MNLYLNNRDYDIYTKVVYTYTFHLSLMTYINFTGKVKSRQSDYYNSCVKKFFRPDFFQKFWNFCTKFKKWLLRYIHFWWRNFFEIFKKPKIFSTNFFEKNHFFLKKINLFEVVDTITFFNFLDFEKVVVSITIECFFQKKCCRFYYNRVKNESFYLRKICIL